MNIFIIHLVPQSDLIDLCLLAQNNFFKKWKIFNEVLSLEAKMGLPVCMVIVCN